MLTIMVKLLYHKTPIFLSFHYHLRRYPVLSGNGNLWRKTNASISNFVTIDTNIAMFSQTYTKKHYHYHYLIPLTKRMVIVDNRNTNHASTYNTRIKYMSLGVLVKLIGLYWCAPSPTVNSYQALWGKFSFIPSW